LVSIGQELNRAPLKPRQKMLENRQRQLASLQRMEEKIRSAADTQGFSWRWTEMLSDFDANFLNIKFRMHFVSCSIDLQIQKLDVFIFF
jgi:hypothetical protein